MRGLSASGGQPPEIVNGRAVRRGQQGHARGIPRQTALALLREVAEGRQPALALLKSLRQPAPPGGLRQFHHQLILPARGIDAHMSGADEFRPFANKLFRGGRRGGKDFSGEGVKRAALPLLLPEPHAPQLRAGILEREIQMPGSGAGEIAHLAPHPDKGKMALHHAPELIRQLADGLDAHILSHAPSPACARPSKGIRPCGPASPAARRPSRRTGPRPDCPAAVRPFRRYADPCIPRCRDPSPCRPQ